MECLYCKKPIEEPYGIVISIDGDFVCNEQCKNSYYSRMNLEISRMANPKNKDVNVLDLLDP